MRVKGLSFVLALALVVFNATAAYAARQDVDTNEACDADCSGDEGAEFTADVQLNVPAGTGIAADPASVSLSTTTDGTGSVGFQGASVVTGTVGSSTKELRRVAGGTANDQVIFQDNVFATTTAVIGTGTLSFNGNLTGTTLNFDANGMVRLADNSNVTAAITTSTDGTGSLHALGTSTITGQVGASGAELAWVGGGAASDIVTFTSSMYTTTLSVTGTGSVLVQGDVNASSRVEFLDDGVLQVADGVNINAAVVNSTDGQATIVYQGNSTTGGNLGVVTTGDLSNIQVNGGTLMLAHNAFATNVDINNGGNIRLTGNRTVNGAINNNSGGELDLGANTLTTTGDYTQAAGSNLSTTLTSTTTRGNIAETGTATIAGGSTVNVTVAGNLGNGTVFTIVDSSAGGAVTAPTTIVDNSAVYSFAAGTADTANDLTLTATRSSGLNTLATDGNAQASGTALENIATTATGDMNVVIGELSSLGTAQEVNDALNQIDPNVDGGINAAGFQNITGNFNTVGTRMGNIRDGHASQMGFNTGDGVFEGVGFWTQGYGFSADQDLRDGIEGYDAQGWGVVAGADVEVPNDWRVGIAGGYGAGDVDNKGTPASGTDIESWTGTLYGTQSAENYYLDVLLAASFNNYEGSREILFGGVNRIALADYDGQQYSAKVEWGPYIDFEGQLRFTPLVSLTYSHLSMDDYTETGAQSLNLVVTDQDYDFLQSGLGASLTKLSDGAKGDIVPEIHSIWYYDFIGDKAEITSSFSGGGASFKTLGYEPAQHSFLFGGNITYYIEEDTSLILGYNYEYREDFAGHYGSGTMKVEF